MDFVCVCVCVCVHRQKERRTIFCPPGPLPFRKDSSISESGGGLGRGGRLWCFCRQLMLEKGLRRLGEHWDVEGMVVVCVRSGRIRIGAVAISLRRTVKLRRRLLLDSIVVVVVLLQLKDT